MRALVLVLGFACLGAGLGLGAKALVSWAMHSPRFAIREIIVHTGPRVREEEVLRLADLSAGDNIFAFRLSEAVSAIELHPWVKSASVMRELPDRVVIDVLERKPVAVISLGALYYVDEEGEVFKKVLPGETVDYPVITGISLREVVEDKDKVTPLLQSAVSVIEIARDSLILPEKDISELRLDEKQGLTLVRNGDGMEILLGQGKFADKWRRLEQVLVELGEEASKVAELDLNYQERVTVRFKEGYRVASSHDEPGQGL